MQTIASTSSSIIPESLQYGFTSNVPNLNPMGGNTFNNSLTTNHGFMQDTGYRYQSCYGQGVAEAKRYDLKCSRGSQAYPRDCRWKP
uniref:Uncharacterized protein n=1 Tax=Helianthus annuus TaxID=4232 RepID=A0A251SDJ0_HELAN